MKIVVTGGRDYLGVATIDDVLSCHYEMTALAHGGCPTGADKIADDWAREHGIPVTVYPADWARDGKAAGPIRNARMLAEFAPDRVIAFPGNRGTADCVRKARTLGISVLEIA